MPENMQIKSAMDLNTLASGLNKLSIESAVKNNELADEFLQTVVDYQLFSGMIYTLKLYNKEGKYQLIINLKNSQEASKFDKLLAGWNFEIPEYKFQALNKNLSDLIESIPEVTTKKD